MRTHCQAPTSAAKEHPKYVYFLFPSRFACSSSFILFTKSTRFVASIVSLKYMQETFLPGIKTGTMFIYGSIFLTLRHPFCHQTFLVCELVFCVSFDISHHPIICPLLLPTLVYVFLHISSYARQG